MTRHLAAHVICDAILLVEDNAGTFENVVCT